MRLVTPPSLPRAYVQVCTAPPRSRAPVGCTEPSPRTPLPSTPWHIPSHHKLIDGWDTRCCGGNGHILLTEVMEANCNWIFIEMLRVVMDWDKAWDTRPDIQSRPLRIGLFCSAGRHRSFAKMLLAAAAFGHMGFEVYTEAPCTDLCGCCSPNAFCNEVLTRVPSENHRAAIYSHQLKANQAKTMAICTSAITLAIILQSRWWCDDTKGSVTHM